MVPSGLMPPVIAVSASISSPRMAARTPTVYSPLLLLPSTKPPAGSNLNSYCLGSIPRRSEASATPVQPDADSDGPMPDTSLSAKLTCISPVSDGPTVIRSVIISPTNPSGPWLTARALTSTVRAVASPSSMAWVSRGGPGPSCFGLEASPPQATASSATAASANVAAMADVFPIAFLLLCPAPPCSQGFRRMIPCAQAGTAFAVQLRPARQAGWDQRECDKNRRRQTPERACRGGYPPDMVTGRVTRRRGRRKSFGNERGMIGLARRPVNGAPIEKP